MKKHIHADLIMEWANGAEIEYRMDPFSEWRTSTGSPGWHEDYEYRVKPEPVVVKTYMHFDRIERSVSSNAYNVAFEVNQRMWINDRELDDHIEFIFEDGKLKSVELKRV